MINQNKKQYEQNWLYKKHKNEIEVIQDIDNLNMFWDLISSKGGFPLLKEDLRNEETVFDWGKIPNNYAFFFDYVGCEKEVTEFLLKSSLINHEYVLLDTQYSDPIYKVKSKYFILNWDDFIKANVGEGSVVCTDDFTLLMEFTNDHSYLLKSNFLIKKK